MKDFVKKSIRNILHANIDVHIRRLIAKVLGDEVNFIEKLQSHCDNMTFSDKSRFDIIFQQLPFK